MTDQTQSGQTTGGQTLRQKPPETMTIYGPDGKPHHCAPVDAREILASGAGYKAEPPQSDNSAGQTGATIFDQAYAKVAELGAEREQQSKQQPESAGASASAEAGQPGTADEQSGDQGGGEPAAGAKPGASVSRRKTQVTPGSQPTEKP